MHRVLWWNSLYILKINLKIKFAICWIYITFNTAHFAGRSFQYGQCCRNHVIASFKEVFWYIWSFYILMFFWRVTLFNSMQCLLFLANVRGIYILTILMNLKISGSYLMKYTRELYHKTVLRRASYFSSLFAPLKPFIFHTLLRLLFHFFSFQFILSYWFLVSLNP